MGNLIAKGVNIMLKGDIDHLKQEVLKGKSLGEHLKSEMLGNKSIDEVVTVLESKLTKDIDQIIATRISQIQKEISGGKSILEILNTFESQTVKDIDNILETRIVQIQSETKKFVEEGLHEVRKQLGLTVDREFSHLIVMLRKEAESLIDHGLDKSTKVAERLLGELSHSITEQRREIKIDFTEVASYTRKELNNILPWIAVIAGFMNLAGIIIAWLFARSM
jgi:hypothetical protein